jgi:hypothetical protein
MTTTGNENKAPVTAENGTTTVAQGMKLEFTLEGDVYIISDAESTRKRLQHGKHYLRYGDEIWISYYPTFCYALSPSQADADLVAVSTSPPFFIRDTSSLLFQKGQAHYHLPPGKGFPSFLICDGFSVSSTRDSDERELFESLSKLYRERTMKTASQRAYALVEALSTLKDGGDRLRTKWLKHVNWNKKGTGDPNPYGEDERRAALILHAIEIQAVMAKRPVHRGFPVDRELLTLARDRKTGTTEGWGMWFSKTTPKRSMYTVRLEYSPKHQALVEFYAPGFKGGFVSVRIIELKGTVTNKMMMIKNPEQVQHWVIELTEPAPMGRGGREKSSVEAKKTQWQGATTLEKRVSLLGYMAHRKFWEQCPIRYIMIDPEQRNLLACETLEAPKEWSLEILDDVRIVQDNKRIPIPLEMQLAYVKNIFKKRDENIDAVLHVLFTGTKARIELRCEMFRLYSGGTWLGGRETWNLYQKHFRPVEPEMASVFIECALTGEETHAGKLDLLEEMVLLSMDEPYDQIRPALVKAIDAMIGQEVKRTRKEEEEDEGEALEKLKRWADVERQFTFTL